MNPHMTKQRRYRHKGWIIDPVNNVDFTRDIAVKDGLIYSVKSNLEVNAKSEFDATGCLVTPGLIDCHKGHRHINM
ncbi:hypothetical protein KUTeg_002133 [Tegillarca granosa]|uniref:Uncharacterized protein n=1 Tax=Tegillarca granosa TaxID=220873 RepID=A0ABQ9FWM7_TEGGR|nr:hypothetical protein KUTeg_002133 [Tegillarca granosa]